MLCLGFKPWAADWWTLTIPLSCGGPLSTVLVHNCDLQMGLDRSIGSIYFREIINFINPIQCGQIGRFFDDFGDVLNILAIIFGKTSPKIS